MSAPEEDAEVTLRTVVEPDLPPEFELVLRDAASLIVDVEIGAPWTEIVAAVRLDPSLIARSWMLVAEALSATPQSVAWREEIADGVPAGQRTPCPSCAAKRGAACEPWCLGSTQPWRREADHRIALAKALGARRGS